MKNGIIITILLIIWTVIKLFFKLLAVIIKVLAALIIFFGLYIPLFYALFGIILLATTDFSLGVVGTDQVLFYIGLGLCGVASIIISIRNLIVRPLSAVFAPFVEYRDELRRAREGRRRDDEADRENDPRPAQDPRGYDPYMTNGYYPYGNPYPYAPQYPYEYRSPYGAPPYDGRQPYGDRPDYLPHDPYYADAAPNAGGRASYYDGSEERPPYYGEMPRSDRREHDYSRDYYGGNSRPMPERPLIYYSKRRPGVLVKEYSDRFELYEEYDGTRRYIGTEYKDE